MEIIEPSPELSVYVPITLRKNLRVTMGDAPGSSQAALHPGPNTRRIFYNGAMARRDYLFHGLPFH